MSIYIKVGLECGIEASIKPARGRVTFRC